MWRMELNRFSLQDFMESEGLRLTDLAQKTGLSISFLSELRSGTKTTVSEATGRKIADALNVRVKSISANPNEASSGAVA